MNISVITLLSLILSSCYCRKVCIPICKTTAGIPQARNSDLRSNIVFNGGMQQQQQYTQEGIPRERCVNIHQQGGVNSGPVTQLTPQQLTQYPPQQFYQPQYPYQTYPPYPPPSDHCKARKSKHDDCSKYLEHKLTNAQKEEMDGGVMWKLTIYGHMSRENSKKLREDIAANGSNFPQLNPQQFITFKNNSHEFTEMKIADE